MEEPAIFDKFFSQDNLAEPFDWEPYLEVEKPNESQILVKGDLQEIKNDGSILPPKHYEATFENLIEFHVFLQSFLSYFSGLVQIMRLHIFSHFHCVKWNSLKIN